MTSQTFALLALCVCALGACNPPSIVGPPIESPTSAQALGVETNGPALCSEAWQRTELSLLTWTPEARGYLSSRHGEEPVVVSYNVTYDAHGCSVQLELLLSCHVAGPWSYAFRPVSFSNHKLVHNASELFAELPLGAAQFASRLKGDRALRTDTMGVGIDALPSEATFDVSDLSGSCERATHVVSQVYLGGFAWAFGESRALDAKASLFTATAGATNTAEVGEIHSEGNAPDCERAQRESKLNSGCQMPLHASLLAIKGVQPHTCTDAISCGARCNGGDLASCWELGQMQLEGEVVPHDAKAAAVNFKRTCDGGFAYGCVSLGLQYRFGDGVTQDLARALRLLDQGCGGGDRLGCRALGDMVQSGTGTQADSGRAIDLYARACDAGDGKACSQEAVLLVQACDHDVAVGCSMLGYLTENGLGVPVDLPRAVMFYGRGCEGGDPRGCTALGAMHEDGTGTQTNPSEAVKLYTKACNGGDRSGCTALGLMYEDGTGVEHADVGQAVALYKKACDGGGGDLRGCVDLGDMYRDGNGVERDLAQAQDMFQAICDNGFASGCGRLGGMHENHAPPDLRRAIAAYTKACSGGDVDSCVARKRLEAAR